MQVIIPPLSKTRKMGSQSCRHSGQVKNTGMRQQGPGSTKLHYKGKTSHSSDWVLLTIPGLCCSSSMLLRIMQALMTLPTRETGRNMVHPVNFQPKVNNGDITIPFWEYLPCWRNTGQTSTKSTFLPLPHPARVQEQAFASRVFFSKSNSALPNCLQVQYHQGDPPSSQDSSTPEEILPYTKTVGISATDLQSLDIQILSYDCNSVIAIYAEHLTESISAWHPVTTLTAAKSALKIVFLTPCTIIKGSHFLTKEDTGYLEQFLAGPLSAWSQLHWQGAGPRSPESQRKEQFNVCVGTRLLLWWIISHAHSQQAGKSQRKHFSTGRLQHTAEHGPKVCNSDFTPRPLAPSFRKGGCCKLLAVRAAEVTAYSRSLLQLPKYKNQRCKGIISL